MGYSLGLVHYTTNMTPNAMLMHVAVTQLAKYGYKILQRRPI